MGTPTSGQAPPRGTTRLQCPRTRFLSRYLSNPRGQTRKSSRHAPPTVLDREHTTAPWHDINPRPAFLVPLFLSLCLFNRIKEQQESATHSPFICPFLFFFFLAPRSTTRCHFPHATAWDNRSPGLPFSFFFFVIFSHHGPRPGSSILMPPRGITGVHDSPFPNDCVN